ncbi:MAG: alginate lyase family protein [Segetibacter sp.]|nr:alginate lyase family protein [Segetibacter sp.]
MKLLLTALVFLISISESNAQSNNIKLPFILQNEQKLATYKQLYKNKNKNAVREVDLLIAEANKALTSGPYSVTFQKRKLPPGGDIHDYMSQAPYWWPDSSKPDGKPYIRKDGRINPERDLSKDRGQMVYMSSNARQLALAYYFTGNEQYVKKAADLLRVWFIDTATRMNPNLNFGQYIPGINDGRGIGIIETVGLTNIPDALAMMQQSKYLTANFVTGIKQWFNQYIEWLINNKNGKEERSQINNHGTYYDMQLADFALFIGDKALAQKVIKEQTIARIDQQLTVDGAQPLELVRTKSWGYSIMNLVGWCKLAVIADKISIDLWNTTTVDGKGIRRVFEWFTPYVLKEKTWKYEQIEPFSYDNILTIYSLANSKYANAFETVLNKYPETKNEKAWW